MGHTLICLFVLVTIWGTATACSCIEKSLEQKYCESHFVVRLRIRSELIVPTEEPFGYYEIRSSFWKFPHKPFDRLYTKDSSALCGVTWLKPKARYLVSGTVENELLWIDSCNSIYHKGRLTRDHLKLKRNPPTCA